MAEALNLTQWSAHLRLRFVVVLLVFLTRHESCSGRRVRPVSKLLVPLQLCPAFLPSVASSSLSLFCVALLTPPTPARRRPILTLVSRPSHMTRLVPHTVL